MEASYATADQQIRLAKQYFAKVDAGDATLLDLFTEDAQVYYPTFGTVSGKAAFVKIVQGLSVAVRQFVHDPASMVFTQAGNRLAVEGIETGILADGSPFPASARSQGRYCNVFEFRGTQISRLHIHADPDLAGRHADLFAWPE